MITMLLGGLWHGAAWTFVLWGALHGFYLIVFHAWRQLFCFNCSNIVCKLSTWLVTFFCVVIAWVPFRASSFDEAWRIYCNMFLYTPSQLVNSKNILLIASLVIVTVLLPNCLQLFHKEDIVLEIKQLSKLPNWLYWQPNLFWLMVIFVVSLVNFFNMGIAEPFIYFDF